MALSALQRGEKRAGCDVGAQSFDGDEFAGSAHGSRDDFSREVYCVLGIPIDAVDMRGLLKVVVNAAADRKPFLLSTANLNYLVSARRQPEFRESLLLSDLCPADGMPIVWIARLMGLPIRTRVAGSDMFQALGSASGSAGPMKVFLFGGEDAAAAAAVQALNEKTTGWHCVGHISPGFGSVEEISTDRIIDQINASGADFLLVALGAQKGQLWLLRNHARLRIPVRAHLGATINFAAGTVRRAPQPLRRWGLEWLWRIKEEPHLWRRYGHDGMVLLVLVFRYVIPAAVLARWHQIRAGTFKDLIIERREDTGATTLSFAGAANGANIRQARSILHSELASAKQPIRINLAQTSMVDARFLGLLLMLHKRAKQQGTNVKFVGVSERLRTIFRLNGADFLLATDGS